jgi:hypothetical protein
VTQALVSAVRERLLHSAARRASVLAAELAPELVDVLACPAASSAIRSLLQQNGVDEYMMLAEPQGILGISHKGSPIWIQLETESSLEALDEVLEDARISPAARRRVRERESLIAADWMQQIAAPATERKALTLSCDPLLLAAVHLLPLPPALTPSVLRK